MTQLTQQNVMIHSIKNLLKVKQKYHMQSYHHQELSLLPQLDLIEKVKLNNAAQS